MPNNIQHNIIDSNPNDMSNTNPQDSQMHSPNDMVILTKTFDQPWEASVPDDNFYPSAKEYSQTIRKSMFHLIQNVYYYLCMADKQRITTGTHEP